MTDENIERGAAEEASGTPVTPTEVAADREAPSRGPGQNDPASAGRHSPDEQRPAADKADPAGGTDV